MMGTASQEEPCSSTAAGDRVLDSHHVTAREDGAKKIIGPVLQCQKM